MAAASPPFLLSICHISPKFTSSFHPIPPSGSEEKVEGSQRDLILHFRCPSFLHLVHLQHDARAAAEAALADTVVWTLTLVQRLANNKIASC